MTRVLFVDQTSQLGGAELSLLALVRARGTTAGDRIVLMEDGRLAELLTAEGFDVVVAPLGGRLRNVTRGSGLRAHLAALTATRHQLQRLRSLSAGFEAIYANTAKSAVIASLAFRHRAPPVIYHLRDMITASHFSGVNRCALVQLANRYVARVIANSHATAEAFVAAGGRRRLVTVVPNGFDVGPFDVALARRAASHDARGAGRASSPAAGGSVVAVFGRLAPWKGQDVAIRAVADLPGVELWIVGEALFGEDEYAESLRGLARALGLADRVKFLGFRDDVVELMQRADVVLHTSRAPEPFGRVVVEAMLSARPLVATRGGGVEEIVDDGHTGLLATMGDSGDLARCVRRLLDDPEYAKRLALAASVTARNRYSIVNTVAQTNAVIDAVASPHRLHGKDSSLR